MRRGVGGADPPGGGAPGLEHAPGSTGRKRNRHKPRLVAGLAVAVALLVPLVWHDVVPSIVSMAVTSGEPEVVDEPATTATPAPVEPFTVRAPTIEPSTTLPVVAGPAPTTTTTRRTATTSTASSVTSIRLPPLIAPANLPPPSPGVTLFPVPSPASGPSAIVSGPDGNLWFTEGNRDIVGRITPQGVITEFHTPTELSQPAAVMVGADRNLWFVESGANNVARITPAGAVTEYPIPTPYSGLRDITTGPDGALWFTECNVGKVGRVDAAGHVTEFPAGTDIPGQIAAGSDGNLWYTGNFGTLWRMSPTGTVTSWPVGNLSTLAALTVDHGGNLWYAGSTVDAGRIVRTEPSGKVTEFNVPGRTLLFVAIAEGPDGAMWVTEASSNTVWRLALDGSQKTLSAPSPAAITAGPDGNMWFASGAGNSIGRIALG